jgi:Secretion system C-terminal sorting domain
VTIGIVPSGNDSIKVNVSVIAVAPHNLTNLSLYIPLVEDVVNYAAPNGEGIHYDVFRKSFTGIKPVTFVAPAHNGAPYNFTSTIAKNSIWNQDKLYALAIIQKADKSMVQTEVSPLFDKNGVSSTNQETTNDPSLIIAPNPANDIIFIHSDYKSSFDRVTIYDISGKIVLNTSSIKTDDGMDISILSKGTYLVKIDKNDGKSIISKFVKQ